MKYGKVLFLILAWLILPQNNGWARTPLQALVDNASPGTEVVLPEGIYEGPVKIGKPLTLTGDGEAVIKSRNGQPALIVTGDHVQLKNIRLSNIGTPASEAAAEISGKDHVLEKIMVETSSVGMKLIEASGNKLMNIQINGYIPSGQKKNIGNGVELWDSHENILSNIAISGVQDGIYLQNSKFNVIRNNTISLSRYGIHLMYAEGTKLMDNLSFDNVTGAMVMGAEKATIKGNKFLNNRNHVHSQGLLLYEVFDSLVEENRLEQNRVGIYLEESSGNRISHNQVKSNFIGIEMKKAQDNELQENNFIANVVHGQAIESHQNLIRINYWDDQQGLDVEGNGKSAWEYRIDPYFLTITDNYPAFQLLFQSPGMAFIQELFKTDPKRLLADQEPLIDPLPEAQVSKDGDESKNMNWFLSLLLMTSGLSLYMLGRRSS